MTPLILSGLFLLGLPMLLLFAFRSNAAIMFLAACAGIVLLNSLDPTVVATAGALVPGEGEAYVRLSVVFLSLAFAALMFRGTIRRTTGFFLHGTLVLFSSLMLWTSLPRTTGVSWLVDSTELSIWQTVDDFKTVVIALGLSLSLVVILRGKSKSKH